MVLNNLNDENGDAQYSIKFTFEKYNPRDLKCLCSYFFCYASEHQKPL